MKTVILSVLLISASLAHASDSQMELTEFYNPELNDVSTLVKRPTLGDNVPVSSTSDQNGVCKALGYQKAAVGSATADSTVRGGMVVIGANGVIQNGEVATDRSGYSILEIICVNKAPVGTLLQKTFLRTKVKHAESGAPVSSKSDQNGICKSLGFERAAVGSALGDASVRGPMVILASDGSVSAGEVATSSGGYGIASIVCVNSH